jgi:hypothetical protein
LATFAAGNPDAATSTVSGSPVSVVADGTSISTITVTVLDNVSAPVPGVTVALSQGSGSSTITPINSVTNGSGIAVFTAKNSTVQTVIYTATADPSGLNVTINQTAQVTFRPTPPAWYNALWQRRFAITVPANKVTGTHSDFPVLVAIPAAATQAPWLRDNAQADGDDILFTSSNGTTKLNHEIEKYDSGTGELLAWVRVSSLASSADTTIYLYFKNGVATNQQNKTGVWDSNYVGVWHLPNGTTLNLNDSTTSANNGANSGATASAGQLDGGSSFNSATLQHFTLSNIPAIANAAAVTIQFWGKRSALGNQVLLRQGASGADGTSIGLEIVGDGNVYAEPLGGVGNYGYYASNDTNWHHWVMVFDGAQTGNAARLKIYDNGVSQTLTFDAGNIFPTTGSSVSNLTVGRNGTSAGAYANGSVDEIRISNTVRTANWIKTEYDMTATPTAFVALSGAQEILPDAGNSSVTSSPPAVVANGTATSTITVTVRDAANQPIPDTTVSLTQGGGSSTITPVNGGVTNGSGVATFIVQNTTAQVVTYTATASGVPITQTAQVTFTAIPHPTNSAVSASPTSVVANGIATSTISVTVRNFANQLMSGVTVSLSQGGGTSTITPVGGGVTNGSGVATFTVKSTTVSTVTYTATADPSGANVTITQTAQVTFTTVPPHAGNSTVSASPTSRLANGISTSTITVTVRDADNQTLSGRTVTLSQGAGTSTITPVSGGVTNGSGVATFTVKSTTVGVVTYTATADPAGANVTITQTAQVTFTAVTPHAGNSTVSVTPTSRPANGISTSTVTVTVNDADGQPISGRTVVLGQGAGSSTITPPNSVTNGSGVATFTVKNSVAEVVTYTATVDPSGANVTITQTAQVTFTLVAPHPGTSAVSANPTSLPADGLSTSTILVTVRDSSGQPIAAVPVTLAQGGGTSIIAAGNGGITNSSGVASFSVKSPVAQTVTYSATAAAVALIQNVQVSFTDEPLSGNTDLASLRLSEGTLTPAFAPDVLQYSAEVRNEVTTVVVTATSSDTAATVTIDGKPSPATISPTVGQNTISILVTATNGSTRATTVQLTRLSKNEGGVTQPFTVPDRGAFSTSTAGQTGEVRSGYAVIEPDAGRSAPDGLAVFAYSQNGALVGEVSIPASVPIRSGRVYAEVGTVVNTGIAIANNNPVSATITFYSTGSDGVNTPSGELVLPAFSQISRFLNESPFNLGAFSGSFTFSSTVPVSVIGLLGFTNERSEFLMTTLPVIDLAAPLQSGRTVYPIFTDGNGWSTGLILVNPSDFSITGTVEFFSEGGPGSEAAPVNVTVDGVTNSTFSYTLPPRSARKLQTSGEGVTTQSGTIRVTPTAGPFRPLVTPVGVGVFSYRRGSTTVSNAGVPAVTASTAFRVYVETSGNFNQPQPGWIQTGLAVANAAPVPIDVVFELTDMSGTPTGLTGTLKLPANGEDSLFLAEIPGFQTLPGSFQGVLRVSTSSPAGIYVVGLRGRYNERGDFLITSTPATDELAPAVQERIFAHFVDSGGYTTKFVLYSGSAGLNSTGLLRLLLQSKPSALSLPGPGSSVNSK